MVRGVCRIRGVVRADGVPLGHEGSSGRIGGSRGGAQAGRGAVLDVDGAGGLCVGAVAGRDESHVAEYCGHSILMDSAAEYLSAVVHSVLRGKRLVPADTVSATVRGRIGFDGVRDVERAGRQPADQDHAAAVRHGTVHLLHGVPRRTGAAKTASTVSYALLPDD